MRTIDLIGSAISNTFRSKTRTLLTILAIFVGAFTLTLTSGLGTGINNYIADTVSGAGAADAMTVTKISSEEAPPGPPGSETTPREYDPNAMSTGRGGPNADTVTALTPADITTLSGVEGVRRVDPTRTITPDYIAAGAGTKYVASVGSLVPGQTSVLATGVEPRAGTALEVALPVAYIGPLGFTSNEAAIGQTVTIGITDAARTQHTLDATVVGVTEPGLASPTGASLLINDALSDALFAAQTTGLTTAEADRFPSATVWFAPDATDADITALKDRLTAAGFTGTTTADQLGQITAVIDAIVLVLNAFGVIALLAAAFGIVNTLFMSVQERTREIGLMKAMGMGPGRIFSVFSLEAAFIGLLGAAIGTGIAMLAGTAISRSLAQGLFADLPGLSLIAFDPIAIGGTVLLIMVIAFLSGTLPAARAAKADPVDSLRYE